jgi:tRNA 2-thiouridine synthesizing protein A
MTHHVLDARRLLCPMPVIRTQNAVAQLAPGDTVEVQATDPGVLHDIPSWCRVHGHEVLSTSRSAGEIRVTLRVGAT